VHQTDWHAGVLGGALSAAELGVGRGDTVRRGQPRQAAHQISADSAPKLVPVGSLVS
jgi:hypothetical protein